MCTPIERGWDKTVPGTCVDDTSFLLSNSFLNMAADALVFIMPIPALWQLHRITPSPVPGGRWLTVLVPLRQRLILAGTFTCGSMWVPLSTWHMASELESQFTDTI